MDYWRNCSACKKPIPFGAVHWVCNVSTCNQKRTSFVFCSVACWDTHVPIYNHRQAWALEKSAPISYDEVVERQAKNMTQQPIKGEHIVSEKDMSKEVLVVVSKLKAYVKATADMNTSASVMNAISDKVRYLCDRAIENARNDGRKTLMDRDF